MSIPCTTLFLSTWLTDRASWNDITAPQEALLTESRMNIIRTLVSRPDISLYTLNAPQDAFQGVTPIGIAAWLGMHDVVQLLLERSLHTVCVDGMDAHGATSLMCKTRHIFPSYFLTLQLPSCGPRR